MIGPLALFKNKKRGDYVLTPIFSFGFTLQLGLNNDILAKSVEQVQDEAEGSERLNGCSGKTNFRDGKFEDESRRKVHRDGKRSRAVEVQTDGSR